KYNPHISPLYQGLIFESVQTVEDLMATATTRSGIKLLTTILYNTYQTGRNVAVNFKSNLKIIFDQFLPQQNYTPKPQLQVISSTILNTLGMYKIFLYLILNYLISINPGIE
ncbi:ISAzo13-like element transposase-related protein, partial [Trichormus azollae]|uniref:ISAzo13-like element transposase-related protein n=1 Tax=Trichormus azollae TaxID=1164 RepID=UPI00325DB9DF